jgi:hypothetical protein
MVRGDRTQDGIEDDEEEEEEEEDEDEADEEVEGLEDDVDEEDDDASGDGMGEDEDEDDEDDDEEMADYDPTIPGQIQSLPRSGRPNISTPTFNHSSTPHNPHNAHNLNSASTSQIPQAPTRPGPAQRARGATGARGVARGSHRDALFNPSARPAAPSFEQARVAAMAAGTQPQPQRGPAESGVDAQAVAPMAPGRPTRSREERIGLAGGTRRLGRQA